MPLTHSNPKFSAFLETLPPRSGPFIRAADHDLCHDELADSVTRLEAQLDALHVRAGHRIGLLMDNGPAALLIPLTLLHRARVLPINPGLAPSEIIRLMSDARLDALISDRDAPPGDLPHLHAHGMALTGAPLAPPKGDDPPGLLLLTSGSTGAPKRVFLRPDQLIGSARTIAATLNLSPQDCVVHALPMFHIGALVDLCLAPLVSGGSLRLSAGPSAPDIAACCRQGATWLQLVPTMLAACMADWQGPEAQTIAGGLRFVRSVSSDLAPAKHAQAEAFFGGTPIIQMYGLTEATGQVASNPMPPGMRRLGTVGPADGAQIAILGPDGHPVATGETGEVCLDGPHITEGYEDLPPGASRSGPWLRTGDLGQLDSDGYLTLRGRIKEMINRGGEKISALEVEQVALAQNGVTEAAAFALPHATLGEQVGLAVVSAPDADLSEAALLAALRADLAEFKLPRKIHFVTKMPRLGSGKIDKRALSAQVAVAPQDPKRWPDQAAGTTQPVAPTGAHDTVARIWAEVLQGPRPGLEDDFFDCGGDSLSAVEFLSRVQTSLGRSVPPTLLFDAPRFGDLLDKLAQDSPAKAAQPAHPVLDHIALSMAGWREARFGPRQLMVGLDTDGALDPFFMCAQGRADVVKSLLDPDRPFYMMCSIRDRTLRTEENCLWLADVFAQEIEAVRPDGPLYLGGFCAGAQQMRRVSDALAARGREVRLLLSIDHWHPRPSAYPVLHAATENRTYSASILFAEPERALPILHPAGGAVIRLQGDHEKALQPDLLAPMGVALERYIAQGALPHGQATGLPFDQRARAHRADIRLQAPRFLSRDTDQIVRVTVTNTSDEIWQPTEGSNLTLSAHMCNLDGYMRIPHAGRAHVTDAVAPGDIFEADIMLRYPGTGLPLLLKVTMVDEGIATFGAVQRLVWANPFKAKHWVDP